MVALLPVLALVFAVLGFVLGHSPETAERPPIARALAAILVTIAAVLAASKLADPSLKLPICVGLVSGSLAVLLAGYLPRRQNAEAAYMALGVLAVAAVLAFRIAEIRSSGLAVIVGLGLTALAVAEDRASLTALGGSLVAAATVLGRYGGDTPSYTHAGVALGLGLCLLGLFRQVVLNLGPTYVAWTSVGLRLLALVIAFAIGQLYLGLHTVWLCLALSVAAGVAVWAAVPNDAVTEPGRSALASILWIGLGTLCFGLARGYGMSLALLLGAGIHLILGEKKAATTCGPLLGLVLYRMFREAHIDASRALDLGQHYVLVGFAIGAALPLFPERWWATKPANLALQGLGSLLWTAVWAGSPFLTALLLGPKGVIGFVVGTGFSSLFFVTGVAPTLLPLAGAAAVGGLTALTYGWIGNLTDLSRDEKLHWVLVALLPMAIIGAILSVLGFKKDLAALGASQVNAG